MNKQLSMRTKSFCESMDWVFKETQTLVNGELVDHTWAFRRLNMVPANTTKFAEGAYDPDILIFNLLSETTIIDLNKFNHLSSTVALLINSVWKDLEWVK